MTLVIYGPTVTGKTALAIKLAKKLNGELISADSRQVYRGLDIGSGKISFGSEAVKFHNHWFVDGIKINGFDLRNPQENFTAADFVKFATKTVHRIRESKKLPIIVGGTGFYVKSLLDGIETIGIPSDLKLRFKLEKLSKEELFKILLSLNPEKAKSLNPSDKNNPRRLVRAIEVATSKQKLKDQSQNIRISNSNLILIGLSAPNNFLYPRVDAWLDKRIKNRMIPEIQKLLKSNVSPAWLESLGLEYRWLTLFCQSKITKKEALERLKGDIHNFVRHQKSWFKKLDGIKIFDISKPDYFKDIDKYLSQKWHSKIRSDILSSK